MKYISLIKVLVCKSLLFVALGYLLLIITYQLCQGPERYLNAGNNYIISGMPGYVIYYLLKPHPIMILIDDKIECIYIIDMWIIGKTKNYWFAIDKNNHNIYYPNKYEMNVTGNMSPKEWLSKNKDDIHSYISLESDDEVKKITGIDISDSNLMTTFPPHSIWWPSHYEYKFRSTIQMVSYVGFGYVILIFLIYGLKYWLNSKK